MNIHCFCIPATCMLDIGPGGLSCLMYCVYYDVFYALCMHLFGLGRYTASWDQIITIHSRGEQKGMSECEPCRTLTVVK